MLGSPTPSTTVPDRVDYELGLVVLDDMAAPSGDDVLAVWHERGELVLERLPEALVNRAATRQIVVMVNESPPSPVVSNALARLVDAAYCGGERALDAARGTHAHGD